MNEFKADGQPLLERKIRTQSTISRDFDCLNSNIESAQSNEVI